MKKTSKLAIEFLVGMFLLVMILNSCDNSITTINKTSKSTWSSTTSVVNYTYQKSSSKSQTEPIVNSNISSTEKPNTSSSSTSEIEITEQSVAALDATPKSWSGVYKDNYMKLNNDLISFLGKYNAYYTVPTQEKIIYLTFDLGYENGFTNSILDTLKARNIKSIFFICDAVTKYHPEIVKRILAEGHLIGNHTQNHKNFTQISIADMKSEVVTFGNYLLTNFNTKTKYFRFPSGNYNEKSLFVLNALGYKTLFWDFAYLDWDRANQPDETVAYNIITASFHNGEIMLLHAVSQTNASILPKVLDEGLAQGYQFLQFDK